MKEKGYVRLYRSIRDNPIVWKDSDHIAVWIYLLLNATYLEFDVVFKGKRKRLSPGQLIVGRKSISIDLKIDESKVRRILKIFESEQQIYLETSNKNTLVTIINWSFYQGKINVNSHQTNIDKTTSEQQSNIYNKEKESRIESKENNKKTHGIYENVYLTDEEIEKLRNLNLIDKINDLSRYIESKGNVYKNHYATILNWDKRRLENEITKKLRFKIKPDYKA